MSQNPYMYSGFADGFTRGFELISNAKDRERARAQADRGLAIQEAGEAREAGDHELKREGLRLQNKALDFQAKKWEHDTSPEALERQKNIDNANIEQSRSASSLSRQSVEASKQGIEDQKTYRKSVQTLSAVEQARSYLGSIGKNLTPQLVQDGIDFADYAAALESNDVSKINPNGHQAGIRWINKVGQDLINQGVGKTIDATTAAQHGIAVGSKILSAELVNVLTDKDGNSILQLSMKVKTPTGEEFTYEPPVTEDRESGPDSAIRIVPMSKLKDIAKGARYITSDIMRGLDEGMTLEQMSAQLTATAASYGKPGDDDKVDKVNTITKKDYLSAVNDAFRTLKENAPTGKDDSGKKYPPPTIQDAMDEVDKVLGRPKEKVTKEEAEKAANGGWSVTEVK